MFLNGRNIKWTQLQSKHGICHKLGALGKYFQFISMNKSIANWNYLLAGIEQGLIQQSASTLSQSYSHSKDRFFKKKKIITNKSSSLLLHLHLHLLHFLIMNKSSYFNKKFKKKSILCKSFKKKKKRKFSKNALGLGALDLYFLGCLKKKKKKKFIKFFFRNRKLWSSSIFFSGATSSQLSTLNILRSMEYVLN